MGTPTPWLRSGNTQQRPAPQSDYTRQVAEGGIGALQQARQQRRYGLTGAEQNYRDGGASGVPGVFSYAGPTGKPNDMYDQWLSQVTPQGAPDTGYAYGRTEDGAYAGFKNQGTLQAALRGRAENIRGQDQEMFRALEQMANQGLDGLTDEYGQRRQENTDTERYARTIPTLPDVKPQVVPTSATGQTDRVQPSRIGTEDGQFQSIRDQNDPSVYQQPLPEGVLGNIVSTVAASSRGTMPRSTSEGLNRSDSAAADRYTGMAEMQAKTDYVNKDLNPWLANESAPLLDQQDFAQSGLATPIAMYAQRAGAEYGVDPNIVAGWYPNSSALTDARDQRDLAFLEQTGMTASDYEQALRDIERQQNAAATAQDDQLAQDYAAAGYELTGGQATTSELANVTNLPVEDVYNILDSADYQFAQGKINEALSTQDLGYIEETMTSVLDGAAYTDPAMLNILQTIYKDYIPSDYDLYGQR